MKGQRKTKAGVVVIILLAVLLCMPIAALADRFIDNNNGTVTDTRTGLIWLKNANPCGEKNWADAMAYCASLANGTAGLTDGSVAGQWRLPSKEELEGIGTDPPITWDSGNPPVPWTIPDAPFYNVQGLSYWSSTPYSSNEDFVWIVSGYYGFVSATNKSETLYHYYYTWPVRGESLTTTTTTIPASGGEIIRITNNNANDQIAGVTQQGHVLFITYSADGTYYKNNYYNGNSVVGLGRGTLHGDLRGIDGNNNVYSKQLIEGDTTTEEIFLFDGQNETQITHNNYRDFDPLICNGFIAWTGQPGFTGQPDGTEGYYNEIFLYKPDQPTAVKMSAIKATPLSKQVKLEWQTETEVDNVGFNVWRAEGFQKVNGSLIPAEGSSVMGADYDFFDKWVMNGKLYYYLIEDIDNSGISTFHGPVKATPRWIYGVGK